ncbi:MAG: hypothetical protein LBB83_02630 [Treponema sp.]|jgi:hypothetical protein|nr:hypothetical protein [Treponema sp.]
MKIEKITLDAMERCYAAGTLMAGGNRYAVFASESIDGPCYAYTGDRFEKKEVIWEKGGGTMSLIQIPGSNGEFIAVQRFFPGFQSAEAKLVWGRRRGNGVWEIKDLAPLPYVHRFDLFTVEDEIYVLAAALCGSKKNREDWSDPGKVYTGKLPPRPEDGMSFTAISENHTRNHGYCRGTWKGSEAGFITSDEGLFVVIPPKRKGDAWKVDPIIRRPIGDIALADLDGDGIDELVTIEPFHGDKFMVNKKTENGYETIYRYPGEIEFAHAVSGCTLLGKSAVVGGIRRKNCELFILQYHAEKGYEARVVEQGIGPSNVVVVNGNGRDFIISANHTQNHAAVYVVTA